MSLSDKVLEWVDTAVPQTDTPQFRAWFGDSKVVDTEGRPLKVYHGTSKDMDFSQFRIGRRGAFFVTDPKEASDYAKQNDSQKSDWGPTGFHYVHTRARVMPVYLRVERPYRPTPEDQEEIRWAKSYRAVQQRLSDKAKAQGCDGIDYGHGVWVVFEPGQVKSATGNRGTFDRSRKSVVEAREA